MNVTQGRQNTQLGQVQEFEIQLDESLIFRFQNNSIIIQDQNKTVQMQFLIDGGLLKYQLWDGSQFLPTQSITTPVISSEDSTILPHNPANTYLSMDQNGFRVFINLVESLIYFNQQLSVQMQTLSIDNQLGDFEILMKSALGQQFYIKDFDSGSNILRIGSTSVDLYNRQLKGLQDGVNDQDAATIHQLLSLTPNSIKIRLPDTQVHIKNSLDQDLLNVDNNRLLSNVVLTYAEHQNMTNVYRIPDWYNVQSELSLYQSLSQRDQVNGYAGLNVSGQLQVSAQRPETCRIDNDMLESYNNQTVTTDYITEGNSNKYFRNQRVLDVVQEYKGVPSGIASLDSSGLVPSNQLPPLQVGTTYSGFYVDRTNPAQYPTLTPIVGDRYISTDLQIEEILAALPYTFAGNWIQLTTGGVLSVNTYTGAVSITTDDVPEGIDKYFNSGIQNYKLNNTNQANELIKLNGSSTISTQLIPSTLRLKNGSMQLVDNESNSLDIQNAQTNASVLNITRTQLVVSVPFVNNGVAISSGNQFTDKDYVDSQLLANQPNIISTSNTSVVTSGTEITTTANGLQIRVDGEAQSIQNTPILYNTAVQVAEDQQLATKRYVDDVLSAFIMNSGVSKEYLQALSQTSINANGRITGWGVNVQSQTKSRIDVGLNDTFNVIAGVYRFYIGVKIREFKDNGLMNVAVLVRDSNSLQQYMLFDFRTIIDTSGGNQEFTMTQPYLWKLDTNANIEVYAQVGDTTYDIYESYLLIEEVEKYGVELGRDRITDATLVTSVLTTNQYVDFQVNNVDYGKMQNNALSLAPDIKVKYDPTTTITSENDLVHKKYVDDSVLNSVISITDLGQVFQASLSANQTTFLTSGNPVRFNTQAINTTTTISMDGSGTITLVHGFVYQVSYSVAIQFSGNSGFAIMSFKNVNTLVSVPGSKLYIVTQPSSNNQQTSITIFVDLRSEVAPQPFTLNVDTSLNLGTVYSQYTRITCEQKQIITSQLWDRIQSQSTETRISVFNEGIEHYINGQSMETITNDTSNIQRQLNNANSSIIQKSTTDSGTILNAISNTNSNTTNLRESMIIADVNGEISTIVKSVVTDNIDGNKKISLFGGIDADKLTICSSNPSIPELVIHSPGSLESIPVQVFTKAGYNTTTTIDQANQFTSKQYVDDAIANYIPSISELNPPTADVDFAGYKITALGDATLATDALNLQTGDSRYYSNTVTLDNILVPTGDLSLNSNKINSLGDATLATDALNLQTADSRYYSNTVTLDNILTPTANVDIGGYKITNLLDPTVAQDSATKNYVDSQVTGGGVPIGTVITVAFSIVPANYLECNGASLLRIGTYAALFSAIGTAFGTVDGTHFNIPDLRGAFIRGWNHGAIISSNPAGIYDIDASSRIALKTGGAIGDRVGSAQQDQLQSHVHTYYGGSVNSVNGTGNQDVQNYNFSGNSSNTAATGGHENRPMNIYLMNCIKAL